jgi:rod shape-determining protein MreD
MNSIKGIIIFIVVMLLSSLSLPLTLSAFKPDLFLLWLLAISYNNNQQEDYLCYAWVIGLLANIYYDLPLGSIAIIYVSLSYIFIIYFDKNFELWQKNIFIAASIAVVEGIMFIIRAGQVEFANMIEILPGVLITVIVWYCYIYFLSNKATLKRR